MSRAPVLCCDAPIRELSARVGHTDIFIPQLGMLADECLHHLDTFGIIDHSALHAMARKKVLGAEEGLVLSDNDAGNFVEQSGSGAHDAWAQGADQSEAMPVSAAPSIADADDFCVGSGIAGLHAKIMSARKDFSVGVG